MISFFRLSNQYIVAVQSKHSLAEADVEKVKWLLGDAVLIEDDFINGPFKGPRVNMITPWSTNAVEITQNMGIQGITRIEMYIPLSNAAAIDSMLFQRYERLDQQVFDLHVVKEPIKEIQDIAVYNIEQGLSLSDDEISYLQNVSQRLNRPLTDSEVFGFSQVNSEHCRHKIFNGTFIIDGETKEKSLFQLIKETSKANPNHIVSAYKDNVAFVDGPKSTHFSPTEVDRPSYYEKSNFESIISLKAETHNFPTTVEPFNGAATGSGGEIRDRMAGGKGSIPLAGTAVYMTSYPRIGFNREWVSENKERAWLYQTPLDILIKASNGASDFGNKFGQPLISGSLLTFEQMLGDRLFGYDKVIMLAGGVGYGDKNQALKGHPEKGDKIVVLGGDNYRIGMGGAAVSSADTGEFESGIELNAVQRSNPEMQKRVANVIRVLVEMGNNPIVSIHDHGAGGHLNCLSELVEESGGEIRVQSLPIGDPTLSDMEIIGNESQERMGLIIKPDDLPLLQRIADRERAPMYVVGDVTGDHRFSFVNDQGKKPIDLELTDFFGSSPKTIMDDKSIQRSFPSIQVNDKNIHNYIEDVLSLESVACKDWLTNKVDRCVGGKVVAQQCVGPLQLPLNDCAVMAIDFESEDGIATSIGHASIAGLVNSPAGARLSISEALTNLIFAPLQDGLKGVSLSANWMWPCKNEGEDARLYEAVQAVSDMSIALGINVPTGKDSLSMAQKYQDQTVLSPGTVIISSVSHTDQMTMVAEPVFQKGNQPIYYIDFSNDDKKLGGSALSQVLSNIGNEVPDVKDVHDFAEKFSVVQKAIKNGLVSAGHDISAGGLLTCLLEMCFADQNLGAIIDLSALEGTSDTHVFFSENPGIVLQADEEIEVLFKEKNLTFHKIGSVTNKPALEVTTEGNSYTFDIDTLRKQWYESSYLLDIHQTKSKLATDRFENFANQALKYQFPSDFDGKKSISGKGKRPIAAIIREKGSNSEREMANALYQAGFQVRDVHMTDLISGRETLEDVQFLGAVGGFSNSDVLGSAKGWAGSFKYNEKAKKALYNFFSREDTLSIGICNGCQLFLELDLINPEHDKLSKMTYNDSGKHECQFTSVEIQKNQSVMMTNMEGQKLGVWISHGEGKFDLPMEESDYQIVAKYGYEEYPTNPNGSDYNVAMLTSNDGRHLATMPHIERSFFAWNWAYYPNNRKDDLYSPWVQAFVNARKWCLKHR